MYDLKPVVDRDVEEVAADVHPQYRVELEVFGSRFAGMLTRCVESSGEAFSIWDGGRLIGLSGFRHGQHGVLPWMVPTSERPSNIRAFMQESREKLADYSSELLYNYIHEENTSALRYVRALGFSECELVANFNGSKHSFIQVVKWPVN
ncbi:hypothetical protein [Microbulbifer sp. ZKSA002]|uniref:hypothetical protein n=1 Tax=Microbulbifer sp. ZKSA002 TaxID=3243388 RepID=UPI0040395B4B